MNNVRVQHEEESDSDTRPARLGFDALGALALTPAASAQPGTTARPDSSATLDSPAQKVSDENESGNTFTEPGENGAVLDDVVVEAENEVRQGVEKTSFEFELSAAVIDSFLSEVDKEALEVSPVSGLQPYLNNLQPMASDQTPHLWLPEIPGTPVRPLPRPRTRATDEPLAADDHGLPRLSLSNFRRQGIPPDKLRWDGRSGEGK